MQDQHQHGLYSGYNVSVFYMYTVLGRFGCSCDCALLCADDLLTMKACPPSEEEFVDLFQKIKYSLSLLVRLALL